ncbi:MAG: acyloxyacyl hydrolase [Burkholderiaceae bacterium]|nr:MAG: acyloxyacyl hydrolase [Burkholderiaceae bacterium]TAM00686.1 MAG: acyloxyacyl hydrolase [Pusillimonas sp.]
MLFCLVVGTLIAFHPSVAVAQPMAGSGANNSVRIAGRGPDSMQGLGLQLGFNSDYRKAMLAYETPGLWRGKLPGDWGRLNLSVELGLSYWKSWRGDPDSMWQVSAIPILRWWPRETIYLEAGVGPTVLSRSEFAGRELSTRFQFGSYVGGGILIHGTQRLGIRYSHYSNADIKTPNPGLDVVQLAYMYMF